jgi:hypothetical protein
MKKITLLLSFIACVAFTQAQLVISDDFNYTIGTELKANGWVGTGSTPSTTNPILVTASTISYSGYPGSGSGNEISLTTSGEDLNKSFDAITSGTIYFSTLVNISAAQAAGDYFIHIGDAPTGSTFFGRTFAKLDAEKIAFGIMNSSSGTVTYSQSVYELNTTYLIVVKVDLATKEASLIINPSLTSEPTTGWLSNNTGTSTLPAAGFKTINIRQGTAANAPTLKLDGIRVATSWAALFTTANVSNPSSDKFRATVVGNDLQIKNVANGATVEIFSALGSKVQTSVLENGKVSVDNLSKGMYIVRVGKSTQKFML